MKSYLPWLALVALSVAGCSYIEKERVEKQPIVERAPPVTIVRKPVVVTHPEVIETPALNSCSSASSQFASGSLYCRNGYEYQCVDGEWVSTGPSC
jgi:hypothetical protein